MKRLSVLMILLITIVCIYKPNNQPPPRASMSDYYRAMKKAEKDACRVTKSASGRALIDCVDPSDPHYAGFDLAGHGFRY